jgi:hypothetical protein
MRTLFSLHLILCLLLLLIPALDVGGIPPVDTWRDLSALVASRADAKDTNLATFTKT